MIYLKGKICCRMWYSWSSRNRIK